MKVGQKVYTQRFCTIKVSVVFDSKIEAAIAGYNTDAVLKSNEWGIAGKSTDLYSMEFAAYRK